MTSQAAPPSANHRAAGTKLPPLYEAGSGREWRAADFRREPLLFYLEPYRRYGPLFRVKVDGLAGWVMAGPEANEFFIKNRNLWRYGEAHSFSKRFAPKEMFTLDGQEHRVTRNIYSPGFRVDVVEAQTGRMRQEMASLLRSTEGEEVDLRHLLSYSFFRLTRIALGIPLPVELFDEVLGAEQLLLEGFRDDTDPVRREKFWQKFELVSTAVGECLRSGSVDERGLIGPILAGPRDDDPAFRHQLAVFFLAGPMNGAHEILWTLLLLRAHPGWLARVRGEVAGAAGQGISTAESGDLYAAVLEAERLRPPVSVSVRVAGADFSFAGYDVPKGTRLIHPVTLVHFLDEVYERPLEYRPERQLGATHPPRLHATFGLGTHRCVGMPLARQQVLVTLSELLLNWEVKMLFRPSLSYVLRENVTPRLKRLPARIVRV